MICFVSVLKNATLEPDVLPLFISLYPNELKNFFSSLNLKSFGFVRNLFRSLFDTLFILTINDGFCN